MTCDIAWIDEADGLRHIDQALVQRLVDAALVADGMKDCALTVLLVDDLHSAELHGEHFDDPTPTDVMTLPEDSEDPESGLHLLGDLAVGVEVAAREAASRGRPVGHELALYVVHGLLHLLGHDDVEDEDRALMWAEQVRLLTAEGIAIEDRADD